ncbi:vacuolar protein sorting-associated protein 28 homolog isoform X1 [Phasianus colchicus]|uniref:vacuolar protein sorting-associated protein 28 homolog isoform X1 n=1 Tax=Phasianus colchicus TaxID=9054 RepID=UPI00129E454D|nr:vacuolar protein sorting-associated protein 28 homolog isoform X1 [Phasianus colchicus]
MWPIGVLIGSLWGPDGVPMGSGGYGVFMGSLQNRMSALPKDFEGRHHVLHWLQTLSSMSAADELDDAQVRQMLFDLESAYNAFNRCLHA